MSRGEEIFSPRLVDGGIVWIGKCLVMVGIVAGGAAVGKLSITCIGLIIVFTIFRAVIPYFRLVGELNSDRSACRDEREALMEISAEDLGELLAVDNDDDGSIMKFVRLVATLVDRMTMEQIWETFQSSFDSYWDTQLGPLQDSADQAPVLGLSGSLIGIVAALSALGSGTTGNQALFEAMSTMALTTLAGGGSYVLISGLYRDAVNQVDRHRKDLLFIGRDFLGNGDQGPAGAPVGGGNDDDNPFDLFAKAMAGEAAA